MSSNEMALVKINSLSELEKIANSMVKSRLFGVDNFDQAFSLMMIANARGIHPVKAAMDYHIIQGRPALKADAMLAYFQESGGVVQWKVYTDARVVGAFSHPRSGQNEPIEIEWTIEMASKIMTKENGQRIPLSQKTVWKDYPRAMLRSRCISEGVRTVYPGIVSGFYTEEEVSSFSESEKFNKAKQVEINPYVKRLDPDKLGTKSSFAVVPKDNPGEAVTNFVKEHITTQTIESTVIDITCPNDDEKKFKSEIRLKFKAEAEPIRDEYRMMDADDGCIGDDWTAIHNKLLKNWFDLCDKYKKEYDWFVVPKNWHDGMSKMFGIEE